MPAPHRETHRPVVVPDRPVPRPDNASAFAICELAAEERAVSQARAFAAAQLAVWQIAEDVAYAARVVISEFVTNTVRHSGSPDISLRLAHCRAEVWIEVLDSGLWRAPAARHRDDDMAEGGRGFSLVDSLTQCCGVHRTPDGTCAWAMLPETPTAGPSRGSVWRLYDD
jgi:anti-sigma regulatory factor (Ser/Thr protein kinase)